MSISASAHNPQAHYENFPVATCLCPARLRPAVAALYRFARAADDLADEGEPTAEQRLAALHQYRQALDAACQSADVAENLPWHAIMQPLQAAMRQHRLPAQPLHDLITAFERDVRHTASGYVYPDWQALHDYARYSANPVGRLMLHLYGVHDVDSLAQSDAICTALQFYNFWQDISVDVARQRYYLPQSLCAPLGIDPQAPQQADAAKQSQLIHALLDPTDALMRSGSALPRHVAQQAGWLAGLELQMVVQGGLRIGHKTRALGARAIIQRPRLHVGDLLGVFARALMRQASGS